MTRLFSALVLCSCLVGLTNLVFAEPSRSENDMSAPRPLSAEPGVKKPAQGDYEPDELAQQNHQAFLAFKAGKYDVAQQLMQNIVAGLDHENGSELSLSEALENLYLCCSFSSKTREANEALERAKAIRKAFHMSPPEPKFVEILPNASARQRATRKVEEVVEIAEGRDPLFPPDSLKDKSVEAWSSLMITAQHERDTGEQKKACLSFRKALAIAGTFPKPNDKVVSTMNMLASVYRNMDRPNAARILYLACMDLYEKMGKSETADFANLLDNAGQTLILLHEYAGAQKLLERAEGVFKKIQGPASADLAMTMCNLGEVYLRQKQDEKGEEKIASALDMMRKSLKPEDMRVLITADNLAEVYAKKGKLKEAEDLQKSIVATMEKVVGKGVHPDLCLALHKLAQTLYNEKKYSEAEPLLKRCIDMNRAIYGEKDPRTLQSISAYAVFLEKTGRKEEADRIMKQVTSPG